MKNLISLREWSGEHIEHVLQLAADIKKDPVAFKNAMAQRTLLMMKNRAYGRGYRLKRV